MISNYSLGYCLGFMDAHAQTSRTVDLNLQLQSFCPPCASRHYEQEPDPQVATTNWPVGRVYSIKYHTFVLGKRTAGQTPGMFSLDQYDNEMRKMAGGGTGAAELEIFR